MALFMITLNSLITYDYSNSPLFNIRGWRCSMHCPQFFLRLYSFIYLITINLLELNDICLNNLHAQRNILNLSIILVVIVNYSWTMHREYHDFNGVHVYLRNNRISLNYTSSFLRIMPFGCRKVSWFKIFVKSSFFARKGNHDSNLRSFLWNVEFG